MYEAMSALLIMGIVLGGSLGLAAYYLKVEGNPIAGEIETLLPGSNCGQCGFLGCSDAANALATNNAPVTLCPPGGKSLATDLANKLGIEADLSDMEDSGPVIAFVFEDLCIGCTKCIKRCPTDAIIGASKQIHGVVDDACTGCRKCADVCPTGAITMRLETPTLQTWHWPKPDLPLAS
ncbi:electron transport complex protein RnfB [Cohaesibacter sp. ES.047]|uniref:RnfABCDGE type electron transport complex subunit B n=1 Tax=Cohaesibacter sp. ES.047 TaxID=1798205 RepID=UPI000BB8EA9A|nr:RnfABCDGE type electron transport complex subunit B [Cohaesibacter sp. ES.047]SNY92905.1 electron transport complex protein RnfB [Cohaesibacter sp. ES.047]